MKSFWIVTWLMSSNFIIASSTETQEYISQDNVTLLEIKKFGGFTPPIRRGWEEGVVIKLSGKVYLFEKENTTATKNYTEIANLKPKIILSLQKIIDSLPTDQKLVSEQDGFECSDVPIKNYSANSSQKIIFAERKNCLNYYLKTSVEKSKQLCDLLDSLFNNSH